MFFILNNDQTVVAADDAFLERAGVKSIYVLAERFRLGGLPIDESARTCHIDGQAESFEKAPIQTLLGRGAVYRFDEAAADADAEIPAALEEPQDETELTDEPTPDVSAPQDQDAAPSEDAPEELFELLELDDIAPDESVDVLEPEAKEIITPEPSAQESDEKDDILAGLSLGAGAVATAALLKEAEEDAPSSSQETPADDTAQEALIGLVDEEPDKEETFDLIDLKEDDADLPEKEDDDQPSIQPTQEQAETSVPSDIVDEALTIETPSAEPVETPQEAVAAAAPFTDYRQNADLVGITLSEYTGFLEQFIDESRQKRSDLSGNDLRAFREELTALKDASQLLHLPKFTSKLHEIEGATSEEKNTLIDDYFEMASHVSNDLQEMSMAPQPASTTPSLEEETTAEAEAETETPSAHIDTSLSAHSAEEFLSGITPLPFDFSAKAASTELGLPESLVEEFVTDFIQQSKENIPVFLEAQQTNDIDSIQKTAHLLKGAASNLRIDPLADTLKELQYNEDLTKVSDMLQHFAAQLKALENFAHNFKV